AGLQNPFLVGAGKLRAKTLANHVADLNKAANPAAPCSRHVRQFSHGVAIPNAEVTVDEGVSVGLHVARRGDCLLESWRGDSLSLRVADAVAQPLNRRRQSLGEVAAVAFQRRFV